MTCCLGRKLLGSAIAVLFATSASSRGDEILFSGTFESGSVCAWSAAVGWNGSPCQGLAISFSESGVPMVDGALFNRAVVPVLSTTGGTPPIEIEAMMDGDPFESGSSVTGDGAHTLVVEATDADGFQVSRAISFTIDTAGPMFVSVLPAEGTLTSAATIVLSGQLSGASTLTINGANVALSSGQFSSGTLPLAEGSQGFLLVASDLAANSTSLTRVVIRDSLSPSVQISQPAPGVTGSTPITVVGVASDPHLSQVLVNGQATALAGATFTLEGLSLEEGQNQIVAQAFDAAGNPPGSASLSIVLDRSDPVISFTENGQPLGNGALFNRIVSPVVTVADATDLNISVTLDGTPFTSGSPVSEEGTHLLSATAVDEGGNSASLSASFEIDRTAPAFGPIVPPHDTLFSAAEVSLQGEVLGATSVSVDGLSCVLGGDQFSCPPISLEEGERILQIRARDDAGNETPRAHRIRRDGTPPDLVVLTPEEGAYVDEISVVVSGTVSDPNLTEVRVNGTLAMLAGVNFTAGPIVLAEGAATLQVVARDVVENSRTVERSIIVDTTHPEVELIESGAPLIQGALFNRAAIPTIQVTDSSPWTLAATLDGAVFVSGTPVSGEGLHTILAIATDAAGNATTRQVEFRVDGSPPAIVELTPVDGHVTSAAETHLQGRVLGAESLSIDGVPVPLLGDRFLAGPFALTEGARTFQILARDAAGNERVVTHQVTRDTAAPTISIQTPAAQSLLGASTAQVIGQAGDPHLASVSVNGVVASLNGTTWVASQVPLSEGAVNLVARAVDRAGNGAEATREVSRDSEAPVIVISDPAPGTVVPDATTRIAGTVFEPHLDRVTVQGVAATLVGDAWSATVPLSEGETLVVARAVDRLGHSAEATVRVRRDATAPSLEIDSPVEGARIAAENVTVSGTVDDAEVSSVTVNGLAATRSGSSYSLAAVPLLEGENRLVVRARDAQGNEGVRTRLVIRDTIAPVLISMTPPAAAIGIPRATSFEVELSEAPGPSSVSGLQLEGPGGSPVAASVAIAGNSLRLSPDAPLPSATSVSLVVKTDVVDLAGNPLSDASSFEFLVADETAPGAPSIESSPPAFVCAPEVRIAGSAEPDRWVEATGGAGVTRGRSSDVGIFQLDVELIPGSIHRLEVATVDEAGNRSAVTLVQVVHDCEPPAVEAIEPNDEGFEILFSEPIDPSSFSEAVRVSGAIGPLAGTSVLDGDVAAFVFDVPPPPGPIRVEVFRQPRDRAGNLLAFPWVEVFGGDGGGGFVVATAIDEATGRPLAGVGARVVSTNGSPAGEPVPETTSAPDGNVALALGNGTHLLEFGRPGYVSVYRSATVEADLGSDLHDPRLTPLGEASPVGAAGGAVIAGTMSLTVPPGAISQTASIHLVALDGQALPRLLPFGWAPRAAVWIGEETFSPALPCALSLTVDPSSASSAAWIHLDPTDRIWRVVQEVVLGTTTLSLPVDAGGAWALVEADPPPFAVPPPTVGEPLGSLPAPAFDLVDAAVISFDPPTVLPGQRSQATVTYETDATAPSGTTVTLSVAEELQLLDGTVRRESPYRADLIIYREGADAVSRFHLAPSQAARLLPVELGKENVLVLPNGGEIVRGNVIGPQGGSVLNEGGDRVEIPVGALVRPTPVSIESRSLGSLTLPPPAGFEALGAVELGLSGEILRAPARLFLASSGQSESTSGILFAIDSASGGEAWRPIATIGLSEGSSGWSTDPNEPADLPWSGVTQGGIFLFARALSPLGFVRGTVFDVGGAPLGGGLVESVSVEWIQWSQPDGRYAFPAWIGAVELAAERIDTGDRGSGTTLISTGGERATLDLEIVTVRPSVVSVIPHSGATNVPVGIEPTIHFSEPVARASLAASISLRADGDLVDSELVHLGSSVTVRPRSSLVPATTYELRISEGVLDLQGHGMSAAVTSSFTTQTVDVPTTIDLSRVLLYEPGASGESRVQGLAGAVPAGTLVFAENLSRLAATVSVTAGQDGSFELSLVAEVTDRILLHVLISGQNEVVAILGPFRTSDGRGAYVGPEGGTFTTIDGWTFAVPGDAFDETTRVRLLPRGSGPLPVALPESFVEGIGFRLDFGGATSARAIEISLPIPQGAPVSRPILVLREVRAAGAHGWMLHELATLSGGRLVSLESGSPLPFAAEFSAGRASQGSGLVDTFEQEKRILELAGAAPGAMLPGLAFAGNYTIAWTPQPVGFLALPLSFGGDVFVQTQLEGMVTVLNAAVERLLDFAAVLIPTLLGEPVQVTVRDAVSGFVLYEGELAEPPGDGGIAEVPPGTFGDTEPPHPIDGSPLRFFLLETAAGERELFPAVNYEVADGTLTVTGSQGSLAAETRVRILGLDGDEEAFTQANGDGAFSVAVSIVESRRYLLGLGARIDSAETIEIFWNERLADSLEDVRVLDSENRALPVTAELAGDGSILRIPPPGAWPTDRELRLELGTGIMDSAENVWPRNFSLEFRAVGSRVAGTYPLQDVYDVARLGSLLFVAAGQQGLAVLDASDPEHLRPVLPGGLTFPLPLLDVVRSLAVDPHGRVLVAGGGVSNFGVLRIFDPLKLPEILDSPQPAAARGLAWRGATIVSDRLGGTGTQLPSGTPRKVAVYSDDLISTWRAGEAAPDGLVVQFSPGPNESIGTLEVSGNGASGGAPVTLRNRTRASFERSDAAPSGGFSITIAARQGDRIELLRNRKAVAYLATLGVGVEAVDVNAFYDGINEPSPIASEVVGIYSGAGDPALELCNEAVGDLSGAAIGLDLLIESTASPPIDIAALVAFRGLAQIESPPTSVGDMSFVNDLCAEIEGSRTVRGVATAVDLPWDVNHDGRIDENERDRDYAFVSHATGGLLAFDVTVRSDPRLVSRIRLPIVALGVTIDRTRMRAYVAGSSGGVAVVDLSALGTITFVDGDGNGTDDRVLEVVQIPGVQPGSAAAIDASLGLFFIGGSGGVASVAVGAPTLTLVTADGSSSIQELAPLGVPTRNVGTESSPRKLPANFRVRAAVPGVVGPELRVDLAGTGPSNLALDDFGQIEDMPRTSREGETAIVLHRLADEPWEDGYSWYESEELVAVADPRAAKAYVRTARENEEGIPGSCRRCERVAEEISPEATEILSGDAVRAALPQAIVLMLEGIYEPVRLADVAASVPSVRWEPAPSLRQEPTRNANFGTGDVVPGTLLHSGELTRSAVDLFVRGRGLDFALERTYRNQTVGAGPLGPGWELGFRIRLRRLPDGDVELYDGRGRRELFERRDDGTFEAPAGRFAELTRTADGYLLVDPGHTVYRFNTQGRVTSISDAVKDRADRGNEMRFHYDARDRLTEITDSLARRYELDYDDTGRLRDVTDFGERKTHFTYDEHGRLESSTSPRIETGESTFPEGVTTTYAYALPAGSLASLLSTRDNLTSWVDPRGEEVFSVTYSDADGDGRADEATGQEWGGHSLSAAYDFEARRTVVTDRRGSSWTYVHAESGQATRFQDPTGAATQIEIDDEGLVTRQTRPLGGVTEIVYDVEGPRRSRGNVLRVDVTADSRGDNGSAHTLSTATEYEGYSNLPTRIVDARGAVTRIDRDSVGLPRTVVEASGTLESGTTSFEHNEFGQPTQVTNANGHQTRYSYFETGSSNGYLREEVVDPDGLALSTSFETDSRGNVIGITDPRGVRHELTWNEVDWLVESVAAASAASDGSGAPALGIRTTYLHDENGDLVEEQKPFGDTGAGYTRTEADYGVLREVTETRLEVTPGSGDFVVTSYMYDENFNLERITHPEGNYETFEYNDRNLPETHRIGLGAGAPTEPIETATSYDAEGLPVAFEDGRNFGWATRYDGFGRTQASVNPLSERTEWEYRVAEGRVTETRIGGEGTLSISHLDADLRGRVKARTELLWEAAGLDPRVPDGPAEAIQVTDTFLYDAGSNLLEIRDPLQRSSTLTYDAAERRISQADPAGNRTEWELDPSGNAREVRQAEVSTSGAEPATISTEATFDALGRPTTVTDALGNTWQRSFDVRGQAVLEVDPEGALTVSEYDGLDRLRKRTRPEGIIESLEYDRNSRVVAYEDALLQRTTYAYDAADRRISTTYPDATSRVVDAYDANGNSTAWRDANGNVVEQSFDPANRLQGRIVNRGPGVEGVVAEAYTYDALARLTRAQSGSIVTTRAFDSRSNLLREATDGKATLYLRDDVGNALTTIYPSGLSVAAQYESLDRLSSLGSSAAPSAIASFGYRGPGRVASRTLGSSISEVRTFDAIGRTRTSKAGTGGAPLVFEQTSYSPRSLASATTRWDLNGEGSALRYDQAGRLEIAERWAEATLSIPNNSVAPPATIESMNTGSGFQYGPTEHLELQAKKRDGAIDELTLLPSDGSGRNRPAFANGQPLSWDPNGNLIRKGAFSYAYDFRNRLSSVSRDGVGEIATYDYDAFNRRVVRRVGGVERETVWSGWQSIEEYEEDDIASRRVYGIGLDDIVRQEVDSDGNGVLDASQIPLYDRSGHLVALADASGQLIERYEYTPYGPSKIEVDDTPPQLTQIRRSEGGEILISFDDAISGEALRRQLELSEPGSRIEIDDVPFRIQYGESGALKTAAEGRELEPISDDPTVLATWEETPGLPNGRVLKLTPSGPIPAGAAVNIVLSAAGVEDLFGNQPSQPITQSFAWPENAAVLADSAPPEVERVVALPDRIELLFTEPVTPESVNGSVTVDGEFLAWTGSPDGHRYIAETPLPPGPHIVLLSIGIADLSGALSGSTLEVPFTMQGAESQVPFQRPDPQEIADSAALNVFGWKGLPRDSESGLFYARNRFYDLEIGRFSSTDPMSYVDGPSMYGYAGNDPVNKSDPLGLQVAEGVQFRTDCEHFGRQLDECAREQRRALGPVLKELGAMVAEEATPLGVANGISGVLGYDFIRRERVQGGPARGLALLSALPFVVGAVRQLDDVVNVARVGADGVPAPQARFDLPGDDPGTIQGYVQGLQRWRSRSKQASDLFEIEQTGPFNFRVHGGGEKVDIDGFLDMAILDAKFVSKPGSSPFIEGSSIPDSIREKIVKEIDDEFRRLAAVVADPQVPFRSLEIRVNDQRAYSFFESMMEKHQIPGSVVVVNTAISPMRR